MKRLLFVIVVLLSGPGFCFSNTLEWLTWEDGNRMAGEQGKTIMVFIQADWCHLCKRMEDKVFTEKEVKTLIEKYYVPIKLNIEAKDKIQKDGRQISSMELIAELTNGKCEGIPAVLFIPENGKKEINLEVGLKDPAEMKKLLKKNR